MSIYEILLIQLNQNDNAQDNLDKDINEFTTKYLKKKTFINWQIKNNISQKNNLISNTSTRHPYIHKINKQINELIEKKNKLKTKHELNKHISHNCQKAIYQQCSRITLQIEEITNTLNNNHV